MSKKVKVVGYVRVSTVIQKESGESLNTQKQQIRDYCNFKKWELLHIYEDAGISGSKAKKRHSFMEMIQGSVKGDFSLIVFTKLSRFARNARDYYNYQHELEQHGVELVSIKEQIDPTSHNGRLMAGIFALLADWEREMIKEQMFENKMVRWREKRIFTGHAPYGYVWDKKKCEFKIRKREETVLNKILNMYVKLGMSMKDLVIQLNEDGYKSRRAKWSTGTLSGILKNPCYNTCKLVTNAHVYVDGKRTKQKKDESEWIIYDLPRIVSKSLWEQVEKKRHFNVRKQKRTTWQQEFWLRDSLHCMNCGGKIKAKKGVNRKDGSFPKYYVCWWGDCSGKDLILSNRTKCVKTHFLARDIEQYVWDAICFALTGSHNDKDVENALQEAAEDRFSFFTGSNIEEKILDREGIVERLQKEIQGKRLANKRMLEELENSDVELKSIFSKLKENEQEIDLINEKVEKASDEIMELREVLSDKQHYIANKDLLFSIWSDLQDFSATDKKILLESLVPDGIDFDTDSKRLSRDTVLFSMVWNRQIFQYFVDSGKFPSLDQNSCHHFT